MTRRKMLAISGTLMGASTVAVAAQDKNDPARQKLKVIVAGAHPDDPETGCGGTMIKLAELGHDVVALYLTRGQAGIRGKSHEQAANIRTEEALVACKILKARPLFASQVDGNCEITKDRYLEIRKIFADENPDLVFVHWPIDSHRDHRVCSLLVYDVWLKSGKEFALYYYEVMSGHQTQHFFPTHYVDITPVVGKKHSACFAHRSQKIEANYHKDHGKMEVFRGMESGYQYAESFIRHVQSREIPLP